MQPTCFEFTGEDGLRLRMIIEGMERANGQKRAFMISPILRWTWPVWPALFIRHPLLLVLHWAACSAFLIS
jgi:hypothetical protein